MASEVSICNQAISWLGGNPITSLGDASTEAILCNANYSLLRDACLEEGKWAFATKRFVLSNAHPSKPPYGYLKKFELGSNVLIVIEATDVDAAASGTLFSQTQGANGSSTLDWRREENFIVCNADKIYIKTIVRIIDVAKFTSTFNQALSSRIAADIAIPLTESQSKADRYEAKYQMRINTALAIDGMQGKSDRLKTKSQIVQRR